MRIRERTIEAYFIKTMQGVGCWCPKWVSPNNRGVLDRLCFFPSGKLIVVELKAPDGKLSPLQIRTIARLEALNIEVAVLYTKEQVNRFLRDNLIYVIL